MQESINSEQTALKICRALVGMLCKIVLEVHKDYATCDNNNNNILYTNAFELLHKILKLSIICYCKFVGDMSKIRHERNPWNPYAVNKIINAK